MESRGPLFLLCLSLFFIAVFFPTQGEPGTPGAKVLVEREPCGGHREIRLAGGETDRDHHFASVPPWGQMCMCARMCLHACVHAYVHVCWGSWLSPFIRSTLQRLASFLVLPLWMSAVRDGRGQAQHCPLLFQVSLLIYNSKGCSMTEMSNKLEKHFHGARPGSTGLASCLLKRSKARKWQIMSSMLDLA